MNIWRISFEKTTLPWIPQVAEILALPASVRRSLFQEGMPGYFFYRGYSADLGLSLLRSEGRPVFVRFGSDSREPLESIALAEAWYTSATARGRGWSPLTRVRPNSPRLHGFSRKDFPMARAGDSKKATRRLTGCARSSGPLIRRQRHRVATGPITRMKLTRGCMDWMKSWSGIKGSRRRSHPRPTLWIRRQAGPKAQMSACSDGRD